MIELSESGGDDIIFGEVPRPIAVGCDGGVRVDGTDDDRHTVEQGRELRDAIGSRSRTVSRVHHQYAVPVRGGLQRAKANRIPVAHVHDLDIRHLYCRRQSRFAGGRVEFKAGADDLEGDYVLDRLKGIDDLADGCPVPVTCLVEWRVGAPNEVDSSDTGQVAAGVDDRDFCRMYLGCSRYGQ